MKQLDHEATRALLNKLAERVVADGPDPFFGETGLDELAVFAAGEEANKAIRATGVPPGMVFVSGLHNGYYLAKLLEE